MIQFRLFRQRGTTYFVASHFICFFENGVSNRNGTTYSQIRSKILFFFSLNFDFHFQFNLIGIILYFSCWNIKLALNVAKSRWHETLRILLISNGTKCVDLLILTIFEKLFISVFAFKVGNQLLISLARNSSQDLIAVISKILSANLAGLPLYSLKLNSARNKNRNAANGPVVTGPQIGNESSKVPVDPAC